MLMETEPAPSTNAPPPIYNSSGYASAYNYVHWVQLK